MHHALLLPPLLAALAMPAQFAAAQPLTLAPCELASVPGTARCGSFEVPEDRDRPDGRRIALNLVVLAARSASPLPDPLFVLQGGPGQAATRLASFYGRVFDGLRAERDLVLVDQRGTGSSNGLDCQLYGDDDDPQTYLDDGTMTADAVRACLAELSTRADVTRYTTPIAMDDLDAVRAALGYPRINLYATSYGTVAAQVYLRRYPQRVRAAILRGALPIANRWAETYADNAHTALDRLFDLCARDDACRGAFPDPRRALRLAMTRVRAAAVPFQAQHPVSGKAITLHLPAAALSLAVRGALSAPTAAVNLPLALDRAAGGDFDLLGQQALAVRRALAQGVLSWGMFLTVACAEMMPADFDDTPIAGHLLADGRIAELRAACRLWPRASLPADYFTPVHAEHPVLIVSGRLDPTTPPRLAAPLSEHLRGSRHLVIDHAGHSFNNLGGCLEHVMQRFVETADVEGLDTRCTALLPMPAFPLPEG